MKKFLLSILISIGLSGCVHEYIPPPPPVSDATSIKLAEAAAQVSDSLQTLEGIRKAENPFYLKHLPNPQSYCMPHLASIDWTGPIEPLVDRLARSENFGFRVLGTAPAIPVIVTIYKKNVPIALILRDADYQAGTKADIVVYPKQRIVELRYRNF